MVKNSRLMNKRYGFVLVLLCFFFCDLDFAYAREDNVGLQKIPNKVAYDKYETLVNSSDSTDDKSILLRIGSLHFDPLKKRGVEKAGIEHIKQYAINKTGYYIVQFDGPIMQSWKDSLINLGVDIY